MKKITYCRCCKSTRLFLYLNLDKQPLANSYHKGEKLPTYPLEVLLCRDCFHSQLSIVVDPEVMFKNYLYVSGTTHSFQKHCEALALDAVKRCKGKIRVLDIACNDGTQLEYFRKLRCEVFGVDPAENLRSITKNKNIPVIVDYWKQSIARKLKKKFHIITGTNVFAHVDYLDEFLEASRIALADDGILILEFPYAEKMITHNEFDTVYHEHLSYFLVNSFTKLIERLNFHIIDVLQTPIHGGSIRFFLKDGAYRHHRKIYDLIKRENEKGLLTLKSYISFSNRVEENKKKLKKLISDLQHKGKKVIGYGASAKGNTMLNYFEINLDYIVDDNNLKWGYKTPGMNIPIYGPLTLKKEKKQLHIVILSWNFFNEIAKSIIKIRPQAKDDTCILYIPNIKEIRLSNILNDK